MEVYGFNASGAIDATIDGIRMVVPDDPSNRHRQMVTEWEDEGNTIPPYVQPEPPPKTKLYKSNFIRRLTPSEAATLEGVLLSEEPWVRMLYHSVEYFMAPDALVGYLHMVLTGLYGEERADVLLEMEE